MSGSVTKPAAANRRQRKRQRMASHLATTAFQLFEKHGYQAVTMEQIAAEADVAKATLYNYFPVKEALIAHRFRDEIIAGMEDLAGELDAHKTFESRMRHLLRESASWHAERRDYMPYYIGYLNSQTGRIGKTADGDNAASVTHRILSNLFCVAQGTGEITRTLPSDQLAWAFEFLLLGALTRWLIYPESDLTKEFLAVFELFLNGVKVSSKAPRPRRSKNAAAAESGNARYTGERNSRVTRN